MRLTEHEGEFDPSFEPAGMFDQHMDRLNNAVYAVSAFLMAPNFEAAKQVIRETPELRDPTAVRFLDQVIEDVRALGDEAPLRIRDLEAQRAFLMKIQAHDEATGQATSPQAGSSRSAHFPWADQAGRLVAEGRVEEAESVLAQAAVNARATGDALSGGYAEYALHELVFTTIWPASGSRERMARHASAAAEAFSQARDSDGLAAALSRLVAVLIDLNDGERLEATLIRLMTVHPVAGVWWHTYVRAVTSDDPEFSRAQFEWCYERASRLGPDASRYRAICASKLAFLDGRAAADQGALPEEFSALVEDVRQHGATRSTGEDLLAVLKRVEAMRSHARSTTVQWGLSEVYTPIYELASQYVAGSDLEAAIDVIERNTSRSLLVRMSSDVRSADLGWDAPERRTLDELVGHYVRQPTQQRRRLLTLAFDKARMTARHVERRAFAELSGLPRAPSPVPVQRVREMLNSDAVLFCTGPGDVFLITANGCERIGEFSPDGLPHAVEAIRRSLAGGARSVAEVIPGIAAGISERIPDRVRLFLVPYGAMWRIPLAVLGDRCLSDLYRVACVPSLSLLAKLLEGEPRDPRPLRTFVGLADPDGGLPDARNEIRAAAAYYPQPTLLVGADAGPGAYLAAAGHADVLHLGCHGFYLPEYPDFSGLRLSGPTGGAQMLWYSDIECIPLDASLVVLGACHSGTGEVLSGGEYVGVPGALLAAGARTVLAPLWAVEDQSTARMMEAFYVSYADTGSASLALQRAKQATDEWGVATAFQLFGLP